MNVVERILALFVHIGLSVIVFYSVVAQKRGCLPLVIGLHMAVDLFAALYRCGVVELWLCEVWAAVWATAILVIAVKMYRKMKAQPVMATA